LIHTIKQLWTGKIEKKMSKIHKKNKKQMDEIEKCKKLFWLKYKREGELDVKIFFKN